MPFSLIAMTCCFQRAVNAIIYLLYSMPAATALLYLRATPAAAIQAATIRASTSS